jgi:hypothetical protein
MKREINLIKLCHECSFLKILEPDEGFEPPTTSLQVRCSTPELIGPVLSLGLEPRNLSVKDFKSSAFADFAMRAEYLSV